MADFSKEIAIFDKYISQYSQNDPMIEFKYKHTIGVLKFSELISMDLQLSEKEIYLSKIIALLHDIGRFHQISTESSFIDDKYLDHTIYGLDILFKKKLIRKFIKSEEYDDIIKFAIKNHSTYGIEENKEEIKESYAKIIRDADKMDNIFTNANSDFYYLLKSTGMHLDRLFISDSVIEIFYTHQMIPLSKRRTVIDIYLSVIAFVYDLNYPICFKIIKENKIVEKIFSNIPCFCLKEHEIVQDMKNNMICYIDSRDYEN